jgi:hypothetical protein
LKAFARLPKAVSYIIYIENHRILQQSGISDFKIHINAFTNSVPGIYWYVSTKLRGSGIEGLKDKINKFSKKIRYNTHSSRLIIISVVFRGFPW